MDNIDAVQLALFVVMALGGLWFGLKGYYSSFKAANPLPGPVTVVTRVAAPERSNARMRLVFSREATVPGVPCLLMTREGPVGVRTGEAACAADDVVVNVGDLTEWVQGLMEGRQQP